MEKSQSKTFKLYQIPFLCFKKKKEIFLLIFYSGKARISKFCDKIFEERLIFMTGIRTCMLWVNF